MASNEEKEEGTVANQLRSSEPDLCVIVGQGEKKKEYWHHSQVLASHSNYIDTMLATPMKESQSMMVKFPDLKPDIWEAMIGFLTDPVKGHDMNFADAMKVAEGYNQYDFQGGRQLCDRIMSEVFERNYNSSLSKYPDVDLDSLVDAFLVADHAQLENTKIRAVDYFATNLCNDGQCGSSMFSECQIRKLAPLIVKENLLGDYAETITNEDILNPMFPELFVAKQKQKQSSLVISTFVRGLKLSGTSCDADGEFRFFDRRYFVADNRRVWWGGIERRVKIGKLHDDWVIYGEASNLNKQIWWTNPYSRNMLLPPKSGWKSANELASGQPTIEYM